MIAKPANKADREKLQPKSGITPPGTPLSVHDLYKESATSR